MLSNYSLKLTRYGMRVCPLQGPSALLLLRRSNSYRRCARRVPLSGEVAWILPEGRKSYFRGRVIRIDYESAR